MTNSLIQLTETTLSLGLAYVLHSTLLLIGVAVLLRGFRATSHALRERLWKLAVIAPLLTSPIQVGSGVAPIPDGWRVSVVSVEERTSIAPVSAFHGETSSASAGDLVISPKVEMASASEIVSSPPPRGEGARRAGERAAESTISMPTPASEAPSSSLRPPSPRMGEGTKLSSESHADLASGAALPIAELAPAEPLPQSTSIDEPRTTQPGWPPTEPPETSRSELVMTPESTLVETRVASASTLMPEVVASTVAATRRRPSVALEPVAFGIALAVLSSLAGGLLLLVVQRVRFWRRLRTCRLVEDGMTRRELDGLLSRKGIRRSVRLLVSSGFVEPVACGVLRWTIIVPHGVEQRLNREQIEGLLAHELAHLVRGDTAWLWVGNIVCSCLWFQPFNFLARRCWQQAAEFLSDEWAVADANVSPLSLAQCLTQIAEWRLDRQESGASLAAGGHRSTLSSRIDCLVQDERPHDAWKSRRRKRAVLLGVVAVGGGLVWAVPRAEFVHADSPSKAPGETTDSGENATAAAKTEAGLLANVGESGTSSVESAVTPAPEDSSESNPFGPEPRVANESENAASQPRGEDWQAEWNELQAELKGLNADLIRVAELLEKYPGDARVRELAEQVRARAVSFEARRQHLDERLKAEQKKSAAAVDPFYLKDDVEYFPPGPEFKLGKDATND
jgi:beta-lactamase regulating signal transducer with metallopeptidase domain